MQICLSNFFKGLLYIIYWYILHNILSFRPKKPSCTPSLFIEVPIPSHDSEQLSIYLQPMSNLSLFLLLSDRILKLFWRCGIFCFRFSFYWLKITKTYIYKLPIEWRPYVNLYSRARFAWHLNIVRVFILLYNCEYFHVDASGIKIKHISNFH